jgi:UTP--glucose-1-phosphate uridylyltransferase
MKISKAVVTAANPLQRSLPLQRLVDRESHEKTALQLILEEIAAAGIQDVCLVVLPGEQQRLKQAAGDLGERLVFVEQDQPLGYGDALLRARSFTKHEPFLHLVGDHLYLSRSQASCAQQLVEMAVAEDCAVTAVQQTRETQLPFFGAVGGRRIPQRSNLYEITAVLEKPTPTQAEQQLLTAGLRSGYYLCVFGMHIFTPTVMELLQQNQGAAPAGQRVGLSPAPVETVTIF